MILPEMPPTDEIAYPDWLTQFSREWWQGEHVTLIGQTGAGKTFVAADILSIRTYVLVLAIKPHDETLARFTGREPKYQLVKKWPPSYDTTRAVLHFKPKKLADPEQAAKVAHVLDGVYKAKGWCLFLDDCAYVINTLGQRRRVVDLMNVSRSSGISLVSAIQQPSSISAGVPSEIKKQTRHMLVWKYTGEDEIEAAARMTGTPKRQMQELMARLEMHTGRHQRYSDFISITRGYGPQIVRVQ